MADCEIVALAGVRLDPAGGVLRDFTRAEADRDRSYLDRYDRTTLLYDCVWREDLGVHILNAPLFLNLWPLLRDGLRRNGRPLAGVRRREWKRCEQVTVPGPRGGLSLQIGERHYPIAVRDSLRTRFAGRNCVLALNRDNQIGWITDWLRYHVERHGADAAILIDNGSQAYPLEGLAAAVAGIGGLRAAVILSAPYPYGPLSGRLRRNERLAKFFQSGMLNTARADAASAAGAVLSVDIDEVVTGPKGDTVFDAARRHPLGMVTIKGRYGYPADPAMIPCGHGAHRFRVATERQANRKWCVVPSGPIGWHFAWDVHQMGGLLQNLFTEQSRFTHVHCYGTTTGWKSKRRGFDAELVRDPELDALMDRYFSG